MSDETQQREYASGRTLVLQVLGETAEEIELAALDEARKFFGPDVRLAVARDYIAHHRHGDPGGRLYAQVRVYEVKEEAG